jgi:hypothetical protein
VSGLGSKAKTPRLTGDRGVLKIVISGLEIHSHDAKGTGVALANGHPAIDRRVLHQFCERGFHLITLERWERNTIPVRLSNGFVQRKIVVGFAVGARLD